MAITGKKVTVPAIETDTYWLTRFEVIAPVYGKPVLLTAELTAISKDGVFVGERIPVICEDVFAYAKKNENALAAMSQLLLAIQELAQSKDQI